MALYLAPLLRLLWPLSAESGPTWAALIVVALTAWARSFFRTKEVRAVRQEDEKKRARIEKMMEAVLAYTREEEKKKGDERKMPEASRILELLWDETFECRTTRCGKLAYIKETEDLFRKVQSKELRECIDKTRQARNHREAQLAKGLSAMAQNFGDAKKAGAGEDLKEVALTLTELGEHESGEKLLEAIEFAKQAKKNLGVEFIDTDLLREAKQLYRVVYRDQSANKKALLTLVRPVIPVIVYTCFAQVLNSSLRGAFHSIGPWTEVVESGKDGNFDVAYTLLFKLWIGHLVIEFVERISSSYGFRAESTFQQRVRNGVLAALVRQDYEYFDMTPPGVLQERLNRDASELGNNLIRFPQHMFGRASFITVNLILIYQQCPLELFLTAMIPLMIMIPLQYYVFKWNTVYDARERKITEETNARTSEVLREIKTIRQFAMEPQESAHHARGEMMRHIHAEKMMVSNEVVDWFFWSVFVSGLILTMYLGVPYVISGQMKVHELVDVVFKINCHLSFPMREILEDLQKAGKLLQPLGRICDLLQSHPVIEPHHDPSYADADSPSELRLIFARCAESTPKEKKRAGDTHAVLQEAIGKAALSAPLSEPPPAKGAQLVALRTSDHEYVVVKRTGDIDVASLSYPVRAIFSKGLRPDRFRGKIEFDNVHFCYPTERRKKVLNGMSFTVEPGQKVALVGATGCGKSSCMSLIQRLYDPDAGQILIDDVPIQNYDIQYLRSRVVIVDQFTVLLHGTIRDNIAYGVDVTDEEVVQACKDAKAWDFVSEKPDKLMSMILDGGKNLSGGQRQRLAIARAMVRKPDVILLDEATSGLDNETEKLVQESLDKLARQGSALVIAHRLSTVRDSDRIVVVDHGCVVEAGKHEDLISEGADEVDASGLPTVPEGPPEQPTLCRSQTEQLPPTMDDRPDVLSLGRQNSASASMQTTQEAKVSYKRLWNAAAGNQDSMSLTQMQKKVGQMEKELQNIKSKMGAMEKEKAALLYGMLVPTKRLGARSAKAGELGKSLAQEYGLGPQALAKNVVDPACQGW